MSKKSLPKAVADEAGWREGEDDLPEGYTGGSAPQLAKAAAGKPSRQRIEEYFERKRLAEALQEDLGEDFFRA